MLVRKPRHTMHPKISAEVLAEFRFVQSEDPKQTNYIAPHLLREAMAEDPGFKHYEEWQKILKNNQDPRAS